MIASLCKHTYTHQARLLSIVYIKIDMFTLARAKEVLLIARSNHYTCIGHYRNKVFYIPRAVGTVQLVCIVFMKLVLLGVKKALVHTILKVIFHPETKF